MPCTARWADMFRARGPAAAAAVCRETSSVREGHSQGEMLTGASGPENQIQQQAP